MGVKDVLGSSGHFGEEGGPFIGPHEKEPLQKTYPGDSGLPRPETPGSFRGVSGRATEPHHPFDKKTKFQTGDSGLGLETPAYRKTTKTAKRKLQ